jgi:hypothetical protein
MQRSGSLPIEKLCVLYSYKDIDKAVAAMHDGSVRIFAFMRTRSESLLIGYRLSKLSSNGETILGQEDPNAVGFCVCLQGRVDRYWQLVHRCVLGVDKLRSLAEDLLHSEKRSQKHDVVD